MIWLLAIRGKEKGRRFKLTPQQSLTIGRDASNVIRLSDDEVSRQHAVIKFDEDKIHIEDLHSSNGTFVNGVAVDTCELTKGDHLRIGQTFFLLTADPVEIGFFESGLPTQQPASSTHTDSEDLAQLSSVDVHDSDHWVSSVKSDLQFMYGAAIATVHASEVEQMLEKILDLVFDWINVERGCICLWDSKSRKYKSRAIRYRTEESQDVELRIGKSIITYVRDRKEGILTFNAPRKDPVGKGDRGLIEGVQEAICAPISGRATMLGFIYADRLCHEPEADPVEPQFNEDHLKLIVAIGHQVAVNIENAEYYSALVEGERLTAVGRTLATLSHHIKNILQSIHGGTHLIEDGLKSEKLETIKMGWNIVKRNQQHMANLVMDMVSFSKPSHPHRKWHDLNKSVETSIRIATEEAAKSKIKIHWAANPQVVRVCFDRSMIERAIENVLRHMLEAAGEDVEGNILIQLISNPGIVRIVIKDDFQNLNTTEIKELFEPFAMETPTEVHGIGLAVTQKILREHDGVVSAKRRSSKGISVELTLPNLELDADDSTGNFNVGLPNSRDRAQDRDTEQDKPRDRSGSQPQ